MMYKYEMPVCEANMHAAVKEIIAEMKEHNEKYPALMRKVVCVKSWSHGTPDGETDDETWQVVIYERMTELFYIYKITDDWYFDTRKVEQQMLTFSKDEMLGFMGEALAGQEVA